MPRKGRHRKGERVTPKGTRPMGFQPGDPGAPGRQVREPDLLADVRRALGHDHPLALLSLASALLAAVETARTSPFEPSQPAGPSRDELVRSLADVERPETSALLAALAALGSDEAERRRVARTLAGRDHRGGRGYQRPESADGDRRRLAERFFASPFASALGGRDHRDLLDVILWFACDDGPGDPMRWSPAAVEILLADWIPRKVVADVGYLAKAPAVLRGFVRFCHAERGIPPRLTDETIEAVDHWEPQYQARIRSPRPQGPEALLAALGVGPTGPWEMGDEDDGWDDDDDWDDDDWDDDGDDDSMMLAIWERAVSGPEALEALDAAPLPDEAFDWTGIPDDVHDRVAEVLARCDRCCDEVLGAEYRTAARRLLARVARDGPEVFRRRGRADTAAAAICWSVARANDAFDQRRGGLTQKALLAHFGAQQGSIPQRAATLLRAGGFPRDPFDLSLGSPRYLVSRRRQHIVDGRRRLSAGDDRGPR